VAVLSKGWIHLHRSIQDCWLWQIKPFDKARAWVDLLLFANHDERKIYDGGKPITVHRGQYLTSIEKLTDRWGWTRNKTKRFLATLEADEKLTTERTNRWTLVTILNYGPYNDMPTSDEPPNDTPNDSPIEPPLEPQTRIKEYSTIISDDIIVCQTQTSDDGISAVIEAWNTLQDVGISPVTKISPSSKRYTNLKARIREYSLDDVLKAISYIPDSPWLLGQNNRGWTITFEWFVKPNNFPKVLEGQYLSKKSRLQNSEGDDDEWQEG
jgi:hypothetical protein